MSRWSGRRGQVEPVAAIAAVFLVGAALTIYAGAVDGLIDGGRNSRATADATLATVERTLERGGVVDPRRMGSVRREGAAGYALNVTLATPADRWHVGPSPPSSAANASESVSVHVAEGRVRPGRLVVRVWT